MTWSDAARRASAEARKRGAKGSRSSTKTGRIAATAGNESMRMTPMPTPAERDAAVRAAGQRAAAARSERHAKAAERSGNPHIASIIRGNAPSTYQGKPASPYNAAGERVPYSRRRKK
jgi:hypothetical protein